MKKYGIDLPELNKSGHFLDDYLGQAAHKGTEAREAIASGKFDTAWGCYQEMSLLYLKHAEKQNFTKDQTLALIGRVHRAMARLLKKEKRHRDALIHALYFIACSDTPLEKELKYYRPFVNRCKLKKVTINEVTGFIKVWRKSPDFIQIRDKVAEWESLQDG